MSTQNILLKIAEDLGVTLATVTITVVVSRVAFDVLTASTTTSIKVVGCAVCLAAIGMVWVCFKGHWDENNEHI